MKTFHIGQTVRIISCSSESGPVPDMFHMIGQLHRVEFTHSDNCYTVGKYSWIWKDLEAVDITEHLVYKSPKMFDVNNLLTQEN